MSDDVRAFDPARFLTKVNGREYLEVKWRLVWVRTEHPEASIETELVHFDPNAAVFRARVTLPNGASATGWGSEAINDFHDFLEKAETKALGRALAALGYGTQFCQDFEFGADQQRVVDAPVDIRGVRGQQQTGPRQEATPRQLKYLQQVAREAGLSDDELERRATDAFGHPVAQLSRRDVSQLIEQIASEKTAFPDGGSPRATARPSGSTSASGLPGEDPQAKHLVQLWKLVEKAGWSREQAQAYAQDEWGTSVGDLSREQVAAFSSYLKLGPVAPDIQAPQASAEVRVIDGVRYDVETGERLDDAPEDPEETPENAMSRIVREASAADLTIAQWKDLVEQARKHDLLADDIVRGTLEAAKDAIRQRRPLNRDAEMQQTEA